MSELAVKTKDLSRTDWLKLRQSGIGGSDIAAIMGISPYATAYDVYQSKVEPVSEDNMSEPAYWGTVLEDVVAREFAKREELKIQNVNFLMRHPDKPWAIGNIDRAVINPDIAGNVRFKDGVLTTDTILEVKTASEYVGKNWGDEGSDEVPDQYQCQAQWYMGVTNTKVCYMAVLIGGNKYRQYRIERNQELIDALFEAAEDFWVNHVLAGVAPEATTIESAKAKFAKANPNSTLDLADDSDDIAIIDKYVELKEQEKELKAQIDTAQAKLINLVGNNEVLAVGGEIVLTYKNQISNHFDSRGFKKEYPELAEKYTKQSQSRVMRIK